MKKSQQQSRRVGHPRRLCHRLRFRERLRPSPTLAFTTASHLTYIQAGGMGGASNSEAAFQRCPNPVNQQSGVLNLEFGVEMWLFGSSVHLWTKNGRQIPSPLSCPLD